MRPRVIVRASWALICLLIAGMTTSASDSGTGTAHTRLHNAALGARRLVFEPDRVDAGAAGSFLARAERYIVRLTPGEARFAIATPSGTAAPAWRFVTLRFLGAQESMPFSPGRVLPGKTNYFKGPDPVKWRQNVPHYATVTQPNVYPGIDVVYRVALPPP